MLSVESSQHLTEYTLFESENEWQKIEQVPIPLLRASRNFPNVKTRDEKKIFKVSFNDCVDKMRGRGYKMSVFVHGTKQNYQKF